jgi:hypothetical protein
MDSSQSPADPFPTAIHPFFKVGPLMLVLGSLSLVAVMMIVVQTLEWSDHAKGFAVSLIFTFTFGLPVLVALLVAQSVLALIFMSRRRRGWWRTVIVLLPAALLTGGLLAGIASFYPPERRARNELARFLGGPLPASARDFTLHFEGGIDPTRTFEFTLSPTDYVAIRRYRDYTPSGGFSSVPPTPTEVQADEPGKVYYLDYSASRRRCTFRVFRY